MVLAIALFAGAFAQPVGAQEPTPVIDEAPAEPVIVLLGVDRPEAAEQAEAISAHVHGLAELVTTDVRPSNDDPRAWYELAIAQAQRRSAVAVFWLAREDDAHWVLSVVRPERREIRWRRIDADPSAPSAAIEALGIITRATTSALIADTALQMETIAIPEPTPEPVHDATPTRAAAPPVRVRGRAVLAAAYAGTSYARELPWQSGLALEAGWAWRFGLHALLGYTAYQRVRAEAPVGRVELARHPITAWLGYHRRFRALGIGGDAGFVLDYARRHAVARAPDIEAGRDRGGVTTAIAARARASVVAVWRLEVFAAVGVEAWLSRVRYGVERRDGGVDVVLTPRRVRATVAAGLAVRL